MQSHAAANRIKSDPLPLCQGRERELSQIQQLFQDSLVGQGSVIFITGESGIGKTTLLLETKRRLRQEGALVLEAHCHPGDASYAPAVQLLRQALRHQLGRPGKHQPYAEKPLLDLLEGRLNPGAAPCPRPSPLPLTVFDQAALLLEELSQQQPLVLLVHDLDQADDASQQLLSFLARTLAPHPHLGTGRSFRGLLLTTAAHSGQLQSLGAADSNAVILELAGLDAEGLRQLLLTDELLQQLLEATAGKPQRVFALLRQPLPPIGGALAGASAGPQQTLLAILAVLGRPASLETLQAISDLPRAQLQGALAQLLDHEVLQEVYVDSQLRYRFGQAGELRRSYRALEDTERRHWHQRAAQLLQQQGAEQECIASHLLASSAGATAVEAALAAGAQLEQTLSLQRAAELYEAALEQPPAHHEQTATLHHKLRAIYERLGQSERSLSHAQQLCDAAPGDPEAALALARLYLGRGNYRQARLQLEQAEAQGAAAPGDGGQHLRARILAAKAELQHLCGDLDSAFSFAGNGLLLCTSELEQASPEEAITRITLQNILAKIHLDRQETSHALQLIRSNLEFASAAKLPVYQTRALIQLGLTHTRRGEVSAAEGYYLQAKTLADKVGEAQLLGICLQHLGVLAEHKGALAAALDYYQQAVGVFKKLGHRSFLAWVGLDLGKLYLRLGDLARSKAMLELSDRLVCEEAPSAIAINRAQLAGRLAQAEGRGQEAAQSLEMAAAEAQRAGHQERLLGVILDQLELALARDQLAPAAQLLGQLPAQLDAPYCQLRRLFLEAKLAQQRILPDEARPLLRAALERAAGLQDEEMAWQIRLELCLLARSEGRQHEALRLLGEAVAGEQRTAAQLPPDLRERLCEQPARFQLFQLAGELGLPCAENPAAVPPAAAVSRPSLRPVVARQRFGEIIGGHPRMQQIYSQIQRIGPSETTVLIRGESGTGKELIAEALHHHSARRRMPLVKVNCGALVESLLLSELFGHERGAFTGALQRKKGRFELADGGTIFLDEIGDISPKTQVALLRVLQEREFERVGGQQPLRVDVRIICATNRDLEAMVSRGEFREDLYYRLQGVRLDVPPLRERLEDLPLLTEHILAAEAEQRHGQAKRLSPAAEELLRRHSWPGNVRELANTLCSASLLSDGDWLDVTDFAAYPDFKELLAAPAADPVAALPDQPPAYAQILAAGMSLRDLKKQIERECISAALGDSEGNITRAAEILGMKRPRLSQLIKEHGIPIG